jgi:TPR repeat protein
MEATRQPSILTSLILFLVLASAGFIATHISLLTIFVILFLLFSGGFVFLFIGKKSFRYNFMYLGLPALGFVFGSIFYYTTFYQAPDPSLEELANRGDAEAQYTLGLFGIVTNDKESVKHLISAAQNGNPKAQYMIGLLLQGSKQKHANSNAYKWLLLSSRGGDKDAKEAIENLNLSPEEKARGERLALEWQNAQ